MTSWADAVVPLGSVLLGGGLTYVLNVRQRRRNDVDDIFIKAAVAVNLAESAQSYMASIDAADLDDLQHQQLRSELAMEGVRNYIRREQEAREALSRAAVYEPSLALFCQAESFWVGRNADEVRRALRNTRRGAKALDAVR